MCTCAILCVAFKALLPVIVGFFFLLSFVMSLESLFLYLYVCDLM